MQFHKITNKFERHYAVYHPRPVSWLFPNIYHALRITGIILLTKYVGTRNQRQILYENKHV